MTDDEEANLPCADKLAFGTETEANTAKIVAQLQRNLVLNVYFCRHCKLWHLASS